MARGGEEQLYETELLSNEQLTPVMRRIVLGGAGLAGFTSSGHADEWLRILVPADPAPVGRWYTVRRWLPAERQLTIDLVIHAHGAATEWVLSARPGDKVTVSAPTGRFEVPEDARWVLVVADQTGLPAAGRILEELPDGLSAYAILEAPNEECVIPLRVPAGAQIRWIFKPAPAEIPSALHLATRAMQLPEGPGHLWMAGEAMCAREIRRYVRHELGWRSSAYDVVGYWRPDSERYLKRYAAIQDQVAEIWTRGKESGTDQQVVTDEVFAVIERHGL